MVTDEMIERATAAYMKETGAEQHQLDGWFEPAISAALEAALSAAEPVGYVASVDFGSSSSIYKAAFAKGQNCVPLYAAPPSPSVAVKALEWDEFSTELKRNFQSKTILGQYQIAYLGEFECWQLYSPQKSTNWKENFSRHKSSEEAKAAAQADYDTRIRSALSAQVQDASKNMATQIEMGHGKVDVSRIDHEGRSGILFRPRNSFIPVGQEGELPAGEYWPVSGDVVIWIANESGAHVIEKYLADFLPDRSAQVQDVAGTSSADQIIGQIEEIFPNWRSYRDLIDCIYCTLHDLRAAAPAKQEG